MAPLEESAPARQHVKVYSARQYNDMAEKVETLAGPLSFRGAYLAFYEKVGE